VQRETTLLIWYPVFGILYLVLGISAEYIVEQMLIFSSMTTEGKRPNVAECKRVGENRQHLKDYLIIS